MKTVPVRGVEVSSLSPSLHPVFFGSTLDYTEDLVALIRINYWLYVFPHMNILCFDLLSWSIFILYYFCCTCYDY